MPFGFDGIDPRREAEKDRAIWAFIWQLAPAVVAIYLAPLGAIILGRFCFSLTSSGTWISKLAFWIASVVALLGAGASLTWGMITINWIGKIVSAYYVGVGLAQIYGSFTGIIPKMQLGEIGLACAAASAVTEIVRNLFFPGKEGGE